MIRLYNMFRWYRAGWGRYSQTNPVGLAGAGSYNGANHLYGYASANPANLIDPRGLVPASLCDQRQIAAINAAAARAEAATRTCLDCSEDRRQWVRRIRNTTIHCVNTFEQGVYRIPSGTCAWAGTPQRAETGRDISVMEAAFTDHDPVSGCGCLEGTVLHEIAHLVRCGGDESCARRIARRCFSCAQEP